MSPTEATSSADNKGRSAHAGWTAMKQDLVHKVPRALKRSAAARAKMKSLRYKHRRIG